MTAETRVSHTPGPANAHLIAAAPELLAAAKTLRDCYSNPHVHEHESCWASLEAAINKAEGREP